MDQHDLQAIRSKERRDGWKNVYTGVGDALRDKSLQGVPEVERLTPQEIDDLLEGSDMPARIVEAPAEDMTRRGWTVHIAGDSKAEKATKAILEDLEVRAKMQEALEYASAFGGAGILLGAMDGAVDISRPLKLDRVKGLKWMNVLAAPELRAVDWYDDVAEEHYGKPSVFEAIPRRFSSGRRIITSSSAASSTVRPLVHESRLLKFYGTRLPPARRAVSSGWGGSVLSRSVRVLRSFDQTWDGAALLLHDFAQAIFKIKGLTDLLVQGDDEAIINRATTIDMARSIARAILLDAEDEDFERKSTSLAGYPEMLDKFSLRLAAAARMPVTKLMGQAPAGLNATGESDIRFWYDFCSSRQTNEILPALNYLLKCIFLSKDGPTNGVEPEEWTVEFAPLWQPTDAEKADVRLKVAQADAVYLTNQVVTSAEVTESRFGGDTYSMETRVDMEAREKLGLTELAPPAPEPDPNATPPPAGGGQQNKPPQGSPPRGPGATVPAPPVEPGEAQAA
jgi:phage-related protein (TIGR01555 family)